MLAYHGAGGSWVSVYAPMLESGNKNVGLLGDRSINRLQYDSTSRADDRGMAAEEAVGRGRFHPAA